MRRKEERSGSYTARKLINFLLLATLATTEHSDDLYIHTYTFFCVCVGGLRERALKINLTKEKNRCTSGW